MGLVSGFGFAMGENWDEEAVVWEEGNVDWIGRFGGGERGSIYFVPSGNSTLNGHLSVNPSFKIRIK